MKMVKGRSEGLEQWQCKVILELPPGTLDRCAKCHDAWYPLYDGWKSIAMQGARRLFWDVRENGVGRLRELEEWYASLFPEHRYVPAEMVMDSDLYTVFRHISPGTDSVTHNIEIGLLTELDRLERAMADGKGGYLPRKPLGVDVSVFDVLL